MKLELLPVSSLKPYENNAKIHTAEQVAQIRRSAMHPTMKPVTLCARLIQNSSKRGDKVIDFFGGSGSTLMACEETGRSCYTLELDPHYADVIIARWEEATGGEAVLLNGAE